MVLNVIILLLMLLIEKNTLNNRLFKFFEKEDERAGDSNDSEIIPHKKIIEQVLKCKNKKLWFGTLSGEPLQNAINTLKSLHGKAGRQVGIISHREEIRENIPVQIKVNLAPGKSSSTIEVTDK